MWETEFCSSLISYGDLVSKIGHLRKALPLLQCPLVRVWFHRDFSYGRATLLWHTAPSSASHHWCPGIPRSCARCGHRHQTWTSTEHGSTLLKCTEGSFLVCKRYVKSHACSGPSASTLTMKQHEIRWNKKLLARAVAGYIAQRRLWTMAGQLCPAILDWAQLEFKGALKGWRTAHAHAKIWKGNERYM